MLLAFLVSRGLWFFHIFGAMLTWKSTCMFLSRNQFFTFHLCVATNLFFPLLLFHFFTPLSVCPSLGSVLHLLWKTWWFFFCTILCFSFTCLLFIIIIILFLFFLLLLLLLLFFLFFSMFGCNVLFLGYLIVHLCGNLLDAVFCVTYPF